MLRPPMQTLHVVDATLDFEGFLVVDSLLHGVCAGGVRMRAGATAEEVQRLARAMTVKFAASGIPIGGAKAGINADPNRPDKQAVIRRFGELVGPFLRDCYLAGEDMGTNRSDIAALYEAAGASPIAVAKARLEGDGLHVALPEEFNAFSDEGPDLDILLTGHGVAAAVAEATDVLGFEVRGAKVSLQGLGNVGAGTVPHLLQAGATIVAVADVLGTLVKEDGLPMDALLACRDALGTIDRSRLPEGILRTPRETWLGVDCDILIPAAVADVIRADNQGEVRARLVVEAANLPVTEEAERALAQRDIAVVPDFIANAGAACGFGLLLTGQVELDPPAIFEEVAKRIRRATRSVLEAWQREGTLPRVAAQAIAEEALATFAAP